MKILSKHLDKNEIPTKYRFGSEEDDIIPSEHSKLDESQRSATKFSKVSTSEPLTTMTTTEQSTTSNLKDKDKEIGKTSSETEEEEASSQDISAAESRSDEEESTESESESQQDESSSGTEEDSSEMSKESEESEGEKGTEEESDETTSGTEEKMDSEESEESSNGSSGEDGRWSDETEESTEEESFETKETEEREGNEDEEADGKSAGGKEEGEEGEEGVGGGSRASEKQPKSSSEKEDVGGEKNLHKTVHQAGTAEMEEAPEEKEPARRKKFLQAHTTVHNHTENNGTEIETTFTAVDPPQQPEPSTSEEYDYDSRYEETNDTTTPPPSESFYRSAQLAEGANEADIAEDYLLLASLLKKPGSKAADYADLNLKLVDASSVLTGR
jgi:hypothetical protein